MPDGAFTAVAAGVSHACGIRPDAGITCWGYRECGPTNLPALAPTPQQPNTPSAVVPASGSPDDVSYTPVTTLVPCNNDRGELEPPDGRFTAVAAGADYSCGLEETGTIRCWGGWSAPPYRPPGQFRAVAVGLHRACAVRTDDTIHCWTDGTSTQASDLPGQVGAIDVGADQTCAVRTDRTILCRLNDHEGQTHTPNGEFVSVTAGETHNCGLRPNGTVECWGGNNLTQVRPRHGRFTDISAGGRLLLRCPHRRHPRMLGLRRKNAGRRPRQTALDITNLGPMLTRAPNLARFSRAFPRNPSASGRCVPGFAWSACLNLGGCLTACVDTRPRLAGFAAASSVEGLRCGDFGDVFSVEDCDGSSRTASRNRPKPST